MSDDSERLTASRSPDESIDVTDHLLSVWRRRWAVLAFGGLCAIGALVVGLLTPRSYEASETIAAISSKFGDEPPQPPDMASFRPFFLSLSTARTVIQELHLDTPPRHLSPSNLVTSVISVELAGTNLIRLTVNFDDPAMAATIAQRVAEHAMAAAQTATGAEETRARDFIKQQVDQAKAKLDQASEALRTFQETAQIEALDQDADAVLQERGGLPDLLVQIAGDKAKLARLEDELAKRTRVDNLTKTIDSDPTLAEAARSAGAQGQAAGKDVRGLQLQTQSVNGVFDKLDSDAAATRAELASLEQQRAELMNVEKVDAKKLPQLTLLYQRRAELTHLQTERDLAADTYQDLSSRYGTARLEVGARTPHLMVLDPAVPPDRPLPRNAARNTAVAGFAGLSLGAVIAMLAGAVRMGKDSQIRS